jgi:simple sugar transport system permease protein
MTEISKYWETLLQMAEATLRVSTPILFAALGGVVSERSGVINIALEGMMLAGALSAVALTLVTHSPWLGLVGAIGAGLLVAMIFAVSVIELKSNQIAAGIGINMLAVGITPLISKLFYSSSTSSPHLSMSLRFQSAPIWIAWICVGLTAVWMNYTASGLWVSFAGEHPDALDAAGVSVRRIRWIAVLTSGVLAGLGGASLSLFLASSFSRSMTAGRGFMALAAMIFGKWKPIPTAMACLLFGFSDALQIRLQGVMLWGSKDVPVQFIQILPYLMTVFILAGFVGKSRAPRALGLPFLKG